MNTQFMDYENPIKSGQIANLRGLEKGQNPVDRRTHANAHLLWDRGWDKQSKIKCRGIELIPGRAWSGCT